jgi:response regulator of citrate/malate metabolism
MSVQVFLIEDDPWVSQVNAQMISSINGFEVQGTARTIHDAKKQILELFPQLLLVDVYLPDGNGLELLHQLRHERIQFDAMMITAANDATSVRLALSDGVFDYLIKPFERSRLETALERYRTRHQWQNGQQLNQAKIDHLLGRTLTPDLPKGIDASKLEQVKHCLRANNTLVSAEQIAVQIGISRVTAWRYLEYLCQTGWAVLENDQSGNGRPVKRYRANQIR